MDYRTFLERNIATQGDPRSRAAAAVILNVKDLPSSSDPRVLAKSLYKVLNPQDTQSFQMSMMVYNQFEPTNELPADLKQDPTKFLEALNAIVDLQNNDPDYRWPSPLHEQKFGKR